MTSTTNTATQSTTHEKPAIIASRQHCEAEGVGLSHYILMDRTASQPETPAAPAAAAYAEAP